MEVDMSKDLIRLMHALFLPGADACEEAPVQTPQASSESAAVLPLLPLRNTVLFPHLFMPLSVGRPPSLAAIDAALVTEEKTFIVSAQKSGEHEQPGFADLYTVGTRTVIK